MAGKRNPVRTYFYSPFRFVVLFLHIYTKGSGSRLSSPRTCKYKDEGSLGEGSSRSDTFIRKHLYNIEKDIHFLPIGF